MLAARLAVKINSEVGRTEYMLVSLVERPQTPPGEPPLSAYPMGKGSGSVTTFSHADGFVTIGRHVEIVEAGSTVNVRGSPATCGWRPLVVIGSHCVGLDYLLGRLQDLGYRRQVPGGRINGGIGGRSPRRMRLGGHPYCSTWRNAMPTVPS